MRIALAAEGTRGDVHPMLDLGRAFLELGHEVRLCGPGNFADDARALEIDFREVGADTRVFLEEMSSAVASRGLEAMRAQYAYFDESFTRQFERLPEATEGCDLILGAGVQLAGASAGELHDVPYHFIAYCPAMLPAREHAPLFLPSQTLPSILNRLAWWLTFRVFDPVLGYRLNRERRKLGLPKLRSALNHILSPKTFMASDPVLAPIPESCTRESQMIGCIHAHEPAPLPEKLESFLAGGSKPVYFGFGSMTDPDPERTTRMILEAVEATGCRAVLSQGWAGLAEGPLCDQVIGIGAVSHASLFPRMAAVVHHGGAGTTTRAAQAGAPQIIIPHLLDQYWWGQRIHSLGLSPPPLPRAKLNKNQLIDAIQCVVGNEFLLQRARDVADQIIPDSRPIAAARAILRSLGS